MSLVYDHRNQCIHIAHDAATYKAFLENQIDELGPNIWAEVGDDIDHQTKYRHEHAHFTSYNAAGLAEWHGLFLDHKLFVLLHALTYLAKKLGGTIFPLIRRGVELGEDREIIDRALRQIREQESYLFGYGSNKSTDELFSWNPQDDFIKLVSQGAPLSMHPNVIRYRSVMRQILYSTDPDIARIPDAATPYAMVGERQVRVSSRSVLEAYAITIEVVSEYIKTVWTSFNISRSKPKRIPGVLDRSALEVCISTLKGEDSRINLEDYVYYRGVDRQQLPELYWCVSLVTYAAMQVPVLENLGGQSTVMGSLKQLSPALRLSHILQNIKSGRVAHPATTYLTAGGETEEQQRLSILNWLNTCHKSIGDPWSIKFYKRIHAAVDAVPKHFDDGSQHSLAWIARWSFWIHPYQLVSEGGLFAPIYIRYINTADDQLISTTSDNDKQSFVDYTMDSSVHIMEALLSDETWSSSWDKLYFKDVETRKIAAAMVWNAYSPTRLTPAEVKFVDGFT